VVGLGEGEVLLVVFTTLKSFCAPPEFQDQLIWVSEAAVPEQDDGGLAAVYLLKEAAEEQSPQEEQALTLAV
jgi:hypothetical protein